jgi:hypothetical protein
MLGHASSSHRAPGRATSGVKGYGLLFQGTGLAGNDLTIFDFVFDFQGVATDFTVVDEDLVSNREIHRYRKELPAVRTGYFIVLLHKELSMGSSATLQ